MKPSLSIEVMPHGWLICAAPGKTGIPLSALADCGPLFGKHALICMGLPHHFNATGYPAHVCVAVAPNGAAFSAWQREIDAAVEKIEDPQQRWWQGTDTGMSSMTIFAALASEAWKSQARLEIRGGSVPLDAGDFGRCARLVGSVPGWRERLPEVEAAYPQLTEWKAIIARWDELVAATRERQEEILSSLK